MSADQRMGRERELAVAEVLRTQYGMVSYRLAWGNADVIGLKAGERPLLVQVKATARAWERFTPVERSALLHEALMAGAHCVLAHWPRHGRLTFYGPDEWPVVVPALVDEGVPA
jgi:hypothetical protein